ncbi:MAE_28990/MAE_18760 family HEPN-like nuclease [Grimontia hollisae]|uniref:MAE_28990/MAE_18760 family HEPN-like nuclease n=1 Tax=Grimontia hollisae TaxID=673 RepID=UPI000DFBF4F5|nr:MAE_28990/MAE_18760 family HEPN-like nuclease [Grimontia hollisae]STQ77012.1 Uncharacterised protein [Grimontia hollisae]
MTLEEFQTQLELERQWREDEIRFFHNLQAKFPVTADRERLRRSIVGLLYAHIEGYVYFAFSLYVEAINNQNLKCKEVKPAIAAASLNAEFVALKNPEKKSTLFKRDLPDDTKLHQVCREINFLESISGIQDKKVKIPHGFINTENNIGPNVLRKLLYQIGLEHKGLDEISKDLNRLRRIRNDIAHGKSKEGIDDKHYIAFKECYETIFNRLSNLMIKSYANKEYLLAS